jgi:hypothetical protein
VSSRAIRFTDDSEAAPYLEQLHEWLREAREVRLVAKHEGLNATSVNAFVDAANGRAKTLTFVHTINGGSICGGYLDVACFHSASATRAEGASFSR